MNNNIYFLTIYQQYTCFKTQFINIYSFLIKYFLIIVGTLLRNTYTYLCQVRIKKTAYLHTKTANYTTYKKHICIF